MFQIREGKDAYDSAKQRVVDIERELQAAQEEVIIAVRPVCF
jgi:hypothetical protein